MSLEQLVQQAVAAEMARIQPSGSYAPAGATPCYGGGASAACSTAASCPSRGLLNQYPDACFPTAVVNTTAPRSVTEEFAYQVREVVSTNHQPMFFGGGHEGARADLESSLRPFCDRARAGDRDSVRDKQIPWALATTPQHYLWQPASYLDRDVFYSTRIAEINCKDDCNGPAVQVRSFT